MTNYIEVVNAARETVAKMLTQRTGDTGFAAVVTTNGGRTAAAMRQGMSVTLDLPSLAPDTMLTRAEADRMVAYLVHEVCHMLHTDFGTWQQAVMEGARVKSWTNALEDLRIEAHEMRVGPYKAMRSLLSGLVSHLYAEARTMLQDQGKQLGHSALNAPYITTVLGRAANGYELPITATLAGELAPNVRKVVQHALQGVRACGSTFDCLVLARELVALEQALKSQEPQQPDAPKPPGNPLGQDQGQGQGDGGDQGDDSDQDGDQGEGDDQGQGDDQGKKAPGKASQDAQEGDQDPTDEGEGDQGAHGEGDQDGEKGETGTPGDQKGGKPGADDAPKNGNAGTWEENDQDEIQSDLSLGKTAESIIERGGQFNPYNNGHRLNSMTAHRKNARNTFGRGDNSARDMLQSMTPNNSILHGQVTRLLVSEARTTRTHHETSGRLDRRALVRMKTGAADVFSRRDYAPGIDTAVMVLIDLSGSMAPRIDLARVTAWALANAAESAGGRLCIAGFKGDGADAVLQYVKSFEQSTAQAAGTLCSIVPNSYTPLSASIVAASQDLASVAATRRILIVLTDGNCDLGHAAVKSACSLAAAVGVETVGIGMNCASVVQAFPPRYSVNVEDLGQLATTGLGILSRMLEETGAK